MRMLKTILNYSLIPVILLMLLMVSCDNRDSIVTSEEERELPIFVRVEMANAGQIDEEIRGILGILHVSVPDIIYMDSVLWGSNRAYASFWNEDRTQRVSMGDVSVDDVILVEHSDQDRGPQYILSASLSEEGAGFPYKYSQNYEYRWKTTGSSEVAPLEFSIVSPPDIVITQPERRSTIDLQEDLQLSWSGGSDEGGIIIHVFPDVTEETPSGTYGYGGSSLGFYRKFLERNSGEFIINSDSLRASFAEDIKPSGLSCSVYSVVINSSLLRERGIIGSIYVVDVLFLYVQSN